MEQNENKSKNLFTAMTFYLIAAIFFVILIVQIKDTINNQKIIEQNETTTYTTKLYTEKPIVVQTTTTTITTTTENTTTTTTRKATKKTTTTTKINETKKFKTFLINNGYEKLTDEPNKYCLIKYDPTYDMTAQMCYDFEEKIWSYYSFDSSMITISSFRYYVKTKKSTLINIINSYQFDMTLDKNNNYICNGNVSDCSLDWKSVMIDQRQLFYNLLEMGQININNL